MYVLKKEVQLSFNGHGQKEVAEKIGIAPETLSRILNKKQNCSKLIAYCITKLNDENAEILDYFEYVV